MTQAGDMADEPGEAMSDAPHRRALALLRGRGQDGSLLRFAELLLAGPDAGALRGYDPDDLARLATDAFAAIAEKPAHGHKVAASRMRMAMPGARESGAAGHRQVLRIEVLNDDMPFLVDSVVGEIHARGLQVALVLHPVFKTERTPRGRLKAILGPGDRNWDDGTQESYICILVSPEPEAEPAEIERTVEEALSSILHDVRRVVTDWKPMLARLDEAIAGYTDAPPPVPVADLAESIQFLKWLAEGHFIFLGMREYALTGEGEASDLLPRPETGLGLLRNPELHVLRRGTDMVHMTAEVRQFFFAPAPLIVTKANVVSHVHRRAHMDYVGVKIYRSDGGIAGELRIVGLFASEAYTESAREIPFLRHKVETVIRRSGYPPESHSAKVLLNVLETFPRDELFQIGVEQLREWAAGIVDLELRPRVRVFARVDEFDRFVSLLVYVPRDRYATEIRERIGAFLAEAYQGRIVAFYPFFSSQEPLVRIQFIVARYEGETPRLEQAWLEAEIGEIVRTWEDRLAARLRAARRRPREVRRLIEKYLTAFSAGYQETFPPERALEDITRIERLSDEHPVAIDFYRDPQAGEARVRAALYQFDRPIRLSERVPVLENLGFSVIDERSYRLKPTFEQGRRPVVLHDMVLETRDGAAVDLEAHDARLEATYLAVWRGEAESDPYNMLVMKAGLDWREAAMMRAYGAYLRQIRTPYGQSYLADTLVRHSAITADIAELFRIRFDPVRPDSEREAAEARVRGRIETALGDIPSLDEDRILRHFTNLVTSTVRTNFYQQRAGGRAGETIAFKLDSAKVEGLPEPRPFAEIFVYSPVVEGVHLRGGPVARGGIRWSDRVQDYRTEVLGLAKAQQVKNAVIVPAGAKGGFVAKRMPREGGREAIMAAGIAAYKLFVSTLLDLTDNIMEGRIVPPEGVVRHDGDDPYLVVAADKGTATFSDTANAIAKAHGFWLGDAFASGGSEGYDHKKMGITARGAFEAVKRHFREMDIDILKTPIRVIGVGDMSGDVFGNGMLLSRTFKLIAAFDHRDIFIDPDPDPEASWAERKRLFALPRSSWQDYARNLISKGGGVFSRKAKSIAVTDEIRAMTGLQAARVPPNVLIRALLKAEADLLWFGGIGTYVRAHDEPNELVGDRANDPLRVTAGELRVKVVGEGANLAMTQRARIAFAEAGGRLNTDFIDNSAGVNSSDLEVNIKIAVDAAIRAGHLPRAERAALLASMTEEVAGACLRNTYLQTLAISLAERRSLVDMGFHQRLMRDLEARGLLDRDLESLPSDADIAERIKASRPLTRPELAVLLGHSKIALFQTLMDTDVPDDPYLARRLTGYFPETLRKRFAKEIAEHRLRREIIATELTNAIVNRGGATMGVRLEEETGHGPAEIASAFVAAESIFGLSRLWRRIDALDNRIAGAVQLDLYLEVQDLLRFATAWFLRHGDFSAGLSRTIAAYRKGVKAMAEALDDLLTPAQSARRAEAVAAYRERGVPMRLASEMAALEFLSAAPDITLVADGLGRKVVEIARIHCRVADLFRLDALKEAAEGLAVTDYFDRLAINSILAAIAAAERALTRHIAREGPPSGDPDARFEAWLTADAAHIARTRESISEVLESGALTLSRLAVAASHIRDLARA